MAERSFLRRLGGGCEVPVGARAIVSGDALKILGVIASPDGSSLQRGECSGPLATAAEIGIELAERLLRAGGDRILASS
jgi:hydroxymethylbilane synthase